MLEKVRGAAALLGYVPDSRARSLKIGRTEQLALSVEDLGNPVYVAMMRAIEAVVREAGFRLVVSASGGDPADEIGIIRGLHRGYADGLILSPLRITDAVLAELAKVRVPVVVIGSLPTGVEIDNVRANSPRGVGLAVRHLADGERRSIAFVNGPLDTVPGHARALGFRKAMRSAGHDIAADQTVAAADFTYEAGAAATTILLDQFRPDAIVCANDLLALGAMRALRERGFDVPGDVAVTGMDDTDLAQMSTPALTSVSLGSEKRGRLAASMLLDRLADPSLPSRRAVVQPRLSPRRSSEPRTRSRGSRR
jgi:LacI family transcriptional regulator